MLPLVASLLLAALPQFYANSEGCDANASDDQVLMQMKGHGSGHYHYDSYHSGSSHADIPGSYRGGCQEYCTSFFQYCQSPQQGGYYQSFEQCMKECPSIPVPKGNAWGKVQNGNTMGCHAWHFAQGINSNTGASFHCNHAFIRDPMLICANTVISGWGKDMRQIVWDTEYPEPGGHEYNYGKYGKYGKYGQGKDQLCKTCECSGDKKVISCGGLNLTQSDFLSLVKELPEEVEILDFSANEITELPDSGVFSKLKNLQGLDLAANAIEKYYSGSLSGLRKLESLILDDNPTANSASTFTRQLPPGFLDDLVSLKEFSCIMNGVTEWDKDLFKYNRNLEIAVLFNNPVSGLASGTFDHTPKLKLLSVVGTPSLDSSTAGFPPGLFDKVPLLEQLHLTLGPTFSDQAWTQVPDAVRSGMKKMPKLKGFVMWNAQMVTSLPEDLFFKNPELDVAYLFNGGFTAFPEKLFAMQRKLRVVGVDMAQLPSSCSFFTGGNYGSPYPIDSACNGSPDVWGQPFSGCEMVCPMMKLLKRNNPDAFVTFGRAWPPAAP